MTKSIQALATKQNWTYADWKRFAKFVGGEIETTSATWREICVGWKETDESNGNAWFSENMARQIVAAVLKHTGGK